jgi:hypothetical protein
MARITVPLINAAQSRDKTLVPLCVPQWFLPHLVSYAETLSEVQYFIGTDEQKLSAMYDGEDALTALMFPEDCQEQVEIPYNSCGDVFMPDSPFISWAPNDPFLDPFGIPIGYQNPPWVNLSRVVPGTQLIGLEETDIITTMLQIIGLYTPTSIVDFLLHIILTGFPRFTIHVVGSGTVELHLLKVPFGGRALVNLDNSLTNNKLVPVTSVEVTDVGSYLSQFLSFIGQGVSGTLFVEEIIEVEIEGDGEHDIHVTMLPNVSGNQLFGFGGGLRSVNFCGDVRGASEVLDIDFRIQGVNLEWRKSPQSSWITLGKVVGDDGTNGVCEPCADDVGYGEPDNSAYYVRGARAIAQGALNDVLAAYLRSTSAMAYRAESLEYALPVSTRVNPNISAPFGNVSGLATVRANWFLEAFQDLGLSSAIVRHAQCILNDLFKNNPFGFLASYTSGSAYTFEDFVNNAYLLNPNPDAPETPSTHTPQQIGILSDILLQALAYYASAYPVNYLNAIRYESNLSAITGIETEECAGLYGAWCRSFDLSESSHRTKFSLLAGLELPEGYRTAPVDYGTISKEIVSISYPLGGDSAIGEIFIEYEASYINGEEVFLFEVLQNGVVQDSYTHPDPPEGFDQSYSYDFGGTVGDEIRITIITGEGIVPYNGGEAIIYSLQADGVGIIPSGGVACSVYDWEIFGGGINGEGLFYPVVLTEWDAVNLNWVSTTPGTSTHEVIVGLDIPSGSVLTELEFTHQTYTSIDRATAYRKEGSANQQVWHYTEDTEDTHLVYPVGFTGPCTLWILVDGQGATKSRLLSVSAKGTGISPE